MKTVNVKIPEFSEKLKDMDYPITFICGKEHYDQLFRIDLESKYGIYYIILKESEINEHGADFLPESETLKDPYHICIQVIPDKIKYSDWIKRIINDTERIGATNWYTLSLGKI